MRRPSHASSRAGGRTVGRHAAQPGPDLVRLRLVRRPLVPDRLALGGRQVPRQRARVRRGRSEHELADARGVIVRGRQQRQRDGGSPRSGPRPPPATSGARSWRLPWQGGGSEGNQPGPRQLRSSPRSSVARSSVATCRAAPPRARLWPLRRDAPIGRTLGPPGRRAGDEKHASDRLRLAAWRRFSARSCRLSRARLR